MKSTTSALYALTFEQPTSPPQHHILVLTPSEAQRWANAAGSFVSLVPPRRPLRLSPLVECPHGRINHAGTQYVLGRAIEPREVSTP